LRVINREDRQVAIAVGKTLPQITRAVEMAVAAIRQGGRLIYLGSGSSGRLGVLDAAECFPTFGTNDVIAVMAGAPTALGAAVEKVEDDSQQAVRDLQKIKLSSRDVLVGISAGGGAPYVLGGMRYARQRKAKVVGLTCDSQAALRAISDVAIIPLVGAEVIAGSSRMKAGTAQKLVLNMLSTATMARLGYVLSGMMINVQATNQKLKKRAEQIVTKLAGANSEAAAKALKSSNWNLPVAILMAGKNISRPEAKKLLRQGSNIAEILRSELNLSRRD
jgi:N-acetylmuramic acid 6-phosphate etherase